MTRFMRERDMANKPTGEQNKKSNQLCTLIIMKILHRHKISISVLS